MPRREAVSRSNTSLRAQTLHLLIAGHVAQFRQLLQLLQHLRRVGFSSSALGSSSVYWNCVRLTRSSTVRSCTGCMNSVMPATFSPVRLQAADHVAGADLALASGFRLI
jgi:hypothetical protein